MAKYDRSFLVPYLQDICALHMAELEVGAKMFEVQRTILEIQHGKEIDPPTEPDFEEEWSVLSLLFAGVGLFLLVAPPLMILLAIGDGIVSNVLLSIGLTIFFSPLGFFIWKAISVPIRDNRKVNEYLIAQHKEEMKKYRAAQEKLKIDNEERRKTIPRYEKQLEYYSNERKKIKSLIERCYRAGVIPTQYRDVYAAVYLYDYFSNSRADDLDQVLNTYVLEQIKAKLDVIINNQRMSILHQRMIISNQRQAIEEQRAHYSFMRNKAKQIAASMEEQNQYLAMVEANTAATAFFSAASYLK